MWKTKATRLSLKPSHHHNAMIDRRCLNCEEMPEVVTRNADELDNAGVEGPSMTVGNNALGGQEPPFFSLLPQDVPGWIE